MAMRVTYTMLSIVRLREVVSFTICASTSRAAGPIPKWGSSMSDGSSGILLS